MRPTLAVLLWLAAGSAAYASGAAGHLLALAANNRLMQAIGRYDPARGWMQSTEFYAPPEPGAVFTLYNASGKVAEVTIAEPLRAYKDGTFADWSPVISSWNSRENPFALAIAGQDPLASEPLQPIALDDPSAQGVVARYLKEKGLQVDAPFLTQAYTLSAPESGRKESILIAHSDASALADDRAAAIYAVALIWWSDHGKEHVFPLVSQTSYKPANRSIDAQEHLYGPREYLRLLSAIDIDGDGWKDIILYRAKDDATQVDVFTFDGRHTRRVLSVYKPNYN